jgi:ferric-dicitrate binding protein FerR (iron transport regulator)
MDIEKIHQFAQNSLSGEEEIEEVVNWIESSGENQKEFNRVKNLWTYSGFFNFDAIIKERKPVSFGWNKRCFEILKYAAILILVFFIGALSATLINRDFFKGQAYNELIVPRGESAEIILADQTHVWLNSGARLIYPSDFRKKNRDVKLSGEAYFEVKHDNKRPFHVITPNLTVEVLGTSFNMEAFENTEVLNVTLVKGRVCLKNNKNKVLTELSPNENARYSIREKKLNISTVNTVLYTSWKEGIMTFKDEKLADIAVKLERWFNVEVIFDQEPVKEIKFSGSILKNKPIDQILDILKFTSNIDYSIQIRDQRPSVIHLKQMPVNK